MESRCRHADVEVLRYGSLELQRRATGVRLRRYEGMERWSRVAGIAMAFVF